MKERLINVLKWFLIILGVLFLLQFLLIIGAIIGITCLSKTNFEDYTPKANVKPFENIIKYLDEFYEDEGKYPDDISSVKKEKNYDFDYKVNSDKSCYTISAKPNKKNKNIQTKRYQKCYAKTDNSMTTSQSYVEYLEK